MIAGKKLDCAVHKTTLDQRRRRSASQVLFCERYEKIGGNRVEADSNDTIGGGRTASRDYE